MQIDMAARLRSCITSPLLYNRSSTLWPFLNFIHSGFVTLSSWTVLTSSSYRFSVLYIHSWLIAVAARSKAWSVFTHSDVGIVGSNPTEDINICLRLFCVCVLCRLGPCIGLPPPPCPKSPTYCLRLRNWSETKRLTDGLCSKWEHQGWIDR
jgi:hypothetical protein